uniref:Uncharacterized protein n=1 Tax=Nelumbo nucifera TaxID=4432 RepID=A0A822YMW2_NELNU|nr:TPA_asm: hypothetical protein HUJ06_012263 [Nelumbo nucifera]
MENAETSMKLETLRLKDGRGLDRRCGGQFKAEIESEPNSIRNESVVLKCDSLNIGATDLHRLWFLTIVTRPERIQIIDLLVGTGSAHLERIHRKPFECSHWFLILPEKIKRNRRMIDRHDSTNLITIRIAESETDIVSGV